MDRNEKSKEVERSIITTYRKKIWNKFIQGITEYDMIKDGDKIAVCMSGGKDSMLLAKCFQELQKHGKKNFDVIYLCMNPGYNEVNKQKILSNCELLDIPVTMFETNIFNAVDTIDAHPCYVCARMRRGHLYKKAQALGCNKIALGHHFDDVIETILMGMFYGSQVQTMMPKLYSSFHAGMELIRPLYFVKEADILAWKERNGLEFIQCACKVTEKRGLTSQDVVGSKREEMKNLIKDLRKVYKNIDVNIFRSVQNVNLDTIISYRRGDEVHHFLDDYDERGRAKQANITVVDTWGIDRFPKN
ncbi:MAG: tRNA 2-thiocytidine biosynthesis protein TtcA [Clostridia bacterium]|nr:tRNA 2-thiocytidine biosynthesis protein TtcA [Clostridia bacterium]